jgi:hypothetical protein
VIGLSTAGQAAGGIVSWLNGDKGAQKNNLACNCALNIIPIAESTFYIRIAVLSRHTPLVQF